MKNVKDALAYARAYLKNKGIIDSPSLDAELLLASCLGLSRASLYANWEREINSREAEMFSALLERRGRGEPVAYLVGHKEFMGLDFLVGPQVLIPRPETELLVEKALDILQKNWEPCRGLPCPEPLIADVGTGSGAIAVSIAKYNSRVRIFATDKSFEALAVARANAERHGVENRLVFLCGNLLEPLKTRLEQGTISLVAANLPYIPSDMLSALPMEVGYEPRIALDGGPDGLALYRSMVAQAYEWLCPGGYLLAEIGSEQGPQVLAVIEEHGAEKWSARLLKDFAGRDRLLCAQKVYSEKERW